MNLAIQAYSSKNKNKNEDKSFVTPAYYNYILSLLHVHVIPYRSSERDI